MDAATFGRYQLLGLIGEGGMGKVYKAHDTVIGRDVAIKVLATDLASERGYQQRFRREAQTAARLNEPHVIPIYDTGEINGKLYLVMPVIDGTDVETLLRREGPMSPPRAVGVVEQLAAALNAAHQHGLVHRDVKPSNALVTPDDFVYLIDFGIAHDTTATRLTQTGGVLGTLAYMAPERFETGVADSRGDVYALACVLYECLTAQQPYPGDSLPQQMNGHLALPPPTPSNRNAAIPRGFDAVVARGLAKDPDQRYQSAIDLAAAARAALTGASPLEVGAATLLSGAQPATAGSTVLRSPSGAQPATAGSTAAPGIATSPPDQRRRNRGLLVGVAAVVVAAVLAGAGIYVGTEHSSNTAPNAAPTAAPPVAEAVLDGLLLGAAEINTAMGATGMTVSSSTSTLSNSDATVSPPVCASIASPNQLKVYAVSGWTAARGQSLREPTQQFAHGVFQGVVLFASAQAAATFASTSLQSWSACANRGYTVVAAGKTGEFTTGPVSNANGIVSVGSTAADKDGRACQRALTAANNVVIEVTACMDNVTGQAVSIASQIAAKTPK